MQWKYREIALKGSIFQELLGNEHDCRGSTNNLSGSQREMSTAGGKRGPFS
jgi:hypothetical protein